MSEHGSRHGLPSRGTELLESFWEEDGKHAPIKASCLAECDLSEELEKGPMLSRIDLKGNPFRMAACVENSASL